MKAGVILDILFNCHFTLRSIFHGSNRAVAASVYLSTEYRDLPALTGYDIRWCRQTDDVMFNVGTMAHSIKQILNQSLIYTSTCIITDIYFLTIATRALYISF